MLGHLGAPVRSERDGLVRVDVVLGDKADGDDPVVFGDRHVGVPVFHDGMVFAAEPDVALFEARESLASGCPGDAAENLAQVEEEVLPVVAAVLISLRVVEIDDGGCVAWCGY